jgi:hypothetical protein
MADGQSDTTIRHPPDSFDLSCRCPAAADEDCPLTAIECRQRLDLRKAGFAAHANTLPRDEIALRLLCAFNGVTDWKKAPPGWWFHPNAACKAAWGRVADEARVIFGDPS